MAEHILRVAHADEETHTHLDNERLVALSIIPQRAGGLPSRG
ncbi:hypothetical protein [Aeoliella sp.]